jgi:hypothetical protein
MKRVHMIKTNFEAENIHKSAKFLKWAFSKLIGELEDIVDQEKKIKHSHI